MKRDLTVYTGAVWFRDCDAHTSVIAVSAKKAESALRRAMRERAKSDAHASDGPCLYCDRGNGGDHISCLLDAQAWSGVHPESLRSILNETRSTFDGGERGKREREDLLESLRADGVAYPDVP